MADGEPLRVLLVEDDENFRFITRRILRRMPEYSVVAEAADGEEGVRAATEHQPEVVLLDIRMPRMDGFEALPLIHDAAPDARVIVYTGLDPEEVREKVTRLGAFDVVEKEASPDALLRVLDRARDDIVGAAR